MSVKFSFIPIKRNNFKERQRDQLARLWVIDNAREIDNTREIEAGAKIDEREVPCCVRGYHLYNTAVTGEELAAESPPIPLTGIL